MMLPLLWWVSLAFQDTAGLRAPGSLAETWIPDGIYLFDNLRTAMELTSLDRLVTNSLIVTISITVLEVTSPPSRGTRWRTSTSRAGGCSSLAIVVLLSVPQLVLVIPLFQLIAALDWVNTYQALILPFIVTPFGVFMMRQLLQHLPRSLLEAARIDGASELRIFLRIVVPAQPERDAHAGDLHVLPAVRQPALAADRRDRRGDAHAPVGLQAMNTNIATPYNALFAVTLVVSLPFILVFLFAQRTDHGELRDVRD